MSDKGELCPICTEEMDLTDQQLKPCQCGYEICVWCWNHIMEMAEKDSTEGRCPACRTPYDKEKIVATAAKCERMVAEINSERKQKSQKPKPKASEGKMYLNEVRVIQRNLVYVIGLPLNLADEELLQRWEYFGQYGKVYKVSISRTATGAIQHSANNSCCVYITYSKEEDAVRCIQSVHGFVLDGKPLRACFGTTKYCHAWLRNLPCSIPDCLYLHDFGSEEESYTKDDLVTAFQRSKVQQFIGATNNMYRAGDVLPPPADQANAGRPSTGRPVAKNPSIVVDNQSKGGGAPDKSNPLPAAASWVNRVSGTVPPASKPPVSVDAPSSKPENTIKSAQDLRTTTKEESCKIHSIGKVNQLEPTKQGHNGINCDIGQPNKTSESISCSSPTNANTGIQTRSLSSSKGVDRGISEEFSNRASQVATKPFYIEAENVPAASSLSHLKNQSSVPLISKGFVPVPNSFNMSGAQGLVQDMNKKFERRSTSLPTREIITSENLPKYDDEQMKGLVLGFNHQSNHDPSLTVARMKSDKVNFPTTTGQTALSNGLNHSLSDKNGTFGYSNVLSEVRLGKYLEGCNKNMGSADISVTSDTGESGIISKILSIDLDTWEDSLALPQDLVQLLNEDDTPHGCLKSGRKIADSKQSRFSFARQDDFCNSRADEYSMPSDLQESRGLCMDNYNNLFPSFSPVESDNNFSTFSNFPVSNVPNSTPPGFSMPCRTTPPPGFRTHGRMQGTFDNSGSHLLQTSAPRAHSMGRFGEMEFVDPAILEIGQGMHPAGMNDMRSYSSVQNSPYDFEAGFQQLMRQPVSEYQTFPNHLNNTPSRNENHFQPNRYSPVTHSTAEPYRNISMSNLGGWDLWNNNVKAVGGDVGMSDLASRRVMGLNNSHPNYEELRSPMSNSSNLYNRGFAI